MHLQSGSGYCGGIANYISALIKSKTFTKYSNHVIAPGTKVTHLKTKNNLYPNALVHDLPPSYSIFSLIPYLVSVYKVLKKEKINILHSHALRSGLIACVISLFLDIRVVHTTHGLRYTQKNMIGSLISFLIESLVLLRSDYVIAIRKSDYRIMLKKFGRFKEKIKFIPTRLGKIAEFSSGEFDGNQLKVIGVGSLIEIKRPKKFVEWIKELSQHGLNVSATWVGDGPLFPCIKKLVKMKNVNISLPGQMSKNEVAMHMKNAHFLFLTSEYEVMPLSVIEAYSCGLPVIANYFSGVEDFVEDGKTGLIIGEKENFIDIIIPIISNSKQFKKMSINAYEKFLKEFYDSELMASQYKLLYESF